MMESLTDKFIKGLQEYNLTYEEIIENNWHYCGGCSGRHLNYFKIYFKGKKLPERSNECVCGHYIVKNCYITDGKQVLILGNCCIKKFIPKNSRTCEKCGNPHKNRIVNRCNNCRKGLCDKCGKKCNVSYKMCYGCFKNDKKERKNRKYDDLLPTRK